jgi:hypothetical protein
VWLLNDVAVTSVQNCVCRDSSCMQHAPALLHISCINSGVICTNLLVTCDDDAVVRVPVRSLLQKSRSDPRTRRRDAQELLAVPKSRISEYKVSSLLHQYTSRSGNTCTRAHASLVTQYTCDKRIRVTVHKSTSSLRTFASIVRGLLWYHWCASDCVYASQYCCQF